MMANTVPVKFAYFGYTAQFDATLGTSTEARRAEANRLIIAAYGQSPAMSYVEPGLPFPDYVPMQVWDWEDGRYD